MAPRKPESTSEPTFGQWLKRRRLGLGLTQVDLAERAGYAPVTLRKVEANSLRPSIAMADRLAAELGVPHEQRPAFVRFARLAAAEAVHSGAPDADASFWLDAATLPHTLPTLPVTLVGRENEITSVRALLLQEGTRLVTLTGPGGVGKTSLALETAWSLLEHTPSSRAWRLFRDGVCFVPLAPIADANLVLPTIAHALRLQEAGGRPPLDSLRENLQDRRLLIVLDNFEHVIGAAPLLAQLLRDCPDLKVLVTSREGLRLRGEKEVTVEPLLAPMSEPPSAVADLLHYDAVRLFVERAQEARHGFTLTEDNAVAVAEICRRLDGLPLALELAASRVKALPPQEILRHLTDSLAFLTQGARDLPDRHRTLRATIDWSYDLLDDQERTLLRRLSVFAGGFTLPAFAAVCNADLALGAQALDYLTSLVDKSLVRQNHDGDGQARFTMLETIREYAVARLVASGEGDALREGWARYFVAFAEEAAPYLTGPAQLEWLDRIEVELENLRAVLSWALADEAAPAARLGLRLATALWRFWSTRSLAGEGPQWFARALSAVSPSAEPSLYAQALLGASAVAMRYDNHGAAREYASRAITLFTDLKDERGVAMGLAYLGCAMPYDGSGNKNAIQAIDASVAILWRVGERWGLARALNFLGLRKVEFGRLAEAQALFRESAALFAAEGDDIERSQPVAHLGGMALLREDYDEAEPWLNEALAISVSVGHQVHVATAHKNLGCLAYGRGDSETALSHWTQALGLYRAAGNTFRTAIILRYIGLVAWEAGEMEEAVSLFTESLALLRATDRPTDTMFCIVALAGVCASLGDTPRAARLLGYAQAQGMDHAPFIGKTADMLVYRRVTATVRAHFDAETFEALQADGAKLDLDAALTYALASVGSSD